MKGDCAILESYFRFSICFKYTVCVSLIFRGSLLLTVSFFLKLKSCWKTQNQMVITSNTLITMYWAVIKIYYELMFSKNLSINFLFLNLTSKCLQFSIIIKRKENTTSLILVSKNSALCFPNTGQPLQIGLKHLKM